MEKNDALLLLAPGCAHCPRVLDALCDLVKTGQLARLEVVNVVERPEVAAAAGTRSVPWTRIGPFELEGLHSREELAMWAAHAKAGSGMDTYLAGLLEHGRLARATALVEAEPGRLADLISLLGSLETPMAVRIGIGAIIEDFAGTATLKQLIPALGQLTGAKEPQIRTDAAHYLGLSEDQAAIDLLRPLLDDKDDTVRETAAESVSLLTGN